MFILLSLIHNGQPKISIRSNSREHRERISNLTEKATTTYHVGLSISSVFRTSNCLLSLLNCFVHRSHRSKSCRIRHNLIVFFKLFILFNFYLLILLNHLLRVNLLLLYLLLWVNCLLLRMNYLLLMGDYLLLWVTSVLLRITRVLLRITRVLLLLLWMHLLE